MGRLLPFLTVSISFSSPLASRYSLYNQPIVLWATAAGWSVSGSSVISVPLKAFGGLFFFFFPSEEDSNANKG